MATTEGNGSALLLPPTSGGSGLSLSIVRAIVERHGGTVPARNERGTLFEILLPATSH